ncbi:hypothetical protein CEP54_005027 [Fusarium duplospermum]|uniref:Uncharacterized protein n=1 Tax=Fusarium duplospermum TaxID=1325734 RepID=A0A428QEW7_9HYPO|nr:hypothetical protein CEP54_005027 [Fusarium duplospermum]
MTKPHQHRHARPSLTSEAWRVASLCLHETSLCRATPESRAIGTRVALKASSQVVERGEKSLCTQQRN